MPFIHEKYRGQKPKVGPPRLRDLEDGGRKLLQSDTNIALQRTDRRQNVKMFAELKDDTKVGNIVLCTDGDIVRPPLLLDAGPKQATHDFAPSETQAGGGFYGSAPGVVSQGMMFYLQCTNQLTSTADTTLGFRLPREHYDIDEATLILKNICQALNRLPGPITSSAPGFRSVQTLAFRTAIEAHSLAQDHQGQTSSRLVVHENSECAPLSLVYYVDVRHLDYAGEVKTKRLSIDAQSIDLDVPAPSAPGTFLLSKPPLPEGATEMERMQRTRALDHLQYFAWTAHGTMSGSLDLETSWDIYKSACSRIYKQGQMWGIYKGAPPLTIWRHHDGQTQLRMTTNVVKDLRKSSNGTEEISVPTLRLNSTSARLIKRVISSYMTSWEVTRDVLLAFEEACVVTDGINTEIERNLHHVPLCDCPDRHASSRVHFCDQCAEPKPCSQLVLAVVTNLRLCKSCDDDQRRDGLAKLKRDMTNSTANERHATGRNNTKALENHLMQLPGAATLTFQDAYVPSKQRRYSSLRRHPLLPSIDAIRPIWHYEGRPAIHCPGNVVVCALYLNLGKWTWPIGVLSILSSYVKGETSIDELDLRMRAVYELHKGIPKNIRYRLALSPSPSRLRKWDAKWRTLAPETRDGGPGMKGIPWPKGQGIPGALDPKPTWRPDGYCRIKSLVEDMIRHWSVKRGQQITVTRIGEDCYYPFEPTMMPPQWTWWQAWRFFTERQARMADHCNYFFVQEASAEKLFLICIWQYCAGYENTRFRLWPLPLTVYDGNPLVVSFGKCVHGKQMVSGWTDEPQSVSDFDPEKCNILIESWFENCTKSDFHERFYQDIRDDFKDVKLSTQYYDPEGAITNEDSLR